MTYSRRRARESALQILYGLDWEAADPEFAIDDYWAKFAGEKPEGFQEVRHHCGVLVRGVVLQRAAIDQRIAAIAQHWKLDRMAAVDRNLLRLATFELLFLGESVPKSVAINEAIEIAKKFGNEDSSAFINGVLDRLAHTRSPTAADEVADRQRAANKKRFGKGKVARTAAKPAGTEPAP